MSIIGYKLKNIYNYDEFENLWETLFKHRKMLQKYKIVLATRDPRECWNDLYFGISLHDYMEMAHEAERPRKLADYSENPIREVARQIQFDGLPLESYFDGDFVIAHAYDEKEILFDSQKQGGVEMKAIVIINETHSLFPEQENILRERFEEIEFVKVPASGWTLEEMRKIAEKLHFQAAGADVRRRSDGTIVSVRYNQTGQNAIVFASPIPYLLRELTRMAVWPTVAVDGVDTRTLYDVLVFHNDYREKKSCPMGALFRRWPLRDGN